MTTVQTRNCSDDAARASTEAEETAYPTHPSSLTPTVIQSQVFTKQAHIPQLYSQLESWLKFTPWEISFGGVCCWNVCGGSPVSQPRQQAVLEPQEGLRPNKPRIPGTSSAREWNVLLGCCWQEEGSLGTEEGRGSHHKVTSVLLGTEGHR